MIHTATLFHACVVACVLVFLATTAAVQGQAVGPSGVEAGAAGTSNVAIKVPRDTSGDAIKPVQLDLSIDCSGAECGHVTASLLEIPPEADSVPAEYTSVEDPVKQAMLVVALAMVAGVVAGMAVWLFQGYFRPKLVVR